jgi:Skp family chaperone for outer membrane proteins
MKTIFKAAALAAMSVGTMTAMPQVAIAQSKQAILSVDTEQLLTNSTAAVAGRALIDARFNQRIASARQIVARDEAALTAAEQAAQRARPSGTGAVPEAQGRAYAQAAQTYQNTIRQAQQLEEVVNGTQNYVNAQILRAAIPIMEQVRAERRASIVVPKTSVYAVDPQTDITGLVLQRLNASLTTVSIDPPQAPAPAATTPPAATQPQPQPQQPQPTGR